MNTSYLFLADGFEEIEALATVDIMRRAGMNVRTVSIMHTDEVTGAHGVTVKAELMLCDTDCSNAEWLILPGGLPGAQYLAECQPLCDLLKKQAIEGKIAAICASPAMVLGRLGILDGKKATGYPGTEQLAPTVDWQPDMVVALDKIITGRGPASAPQFALAIVANSMGESIAKEVAKGMLY